MNKKKETAHKPEACGRKTAYTEKSYFPDKTAEFNLYMEDASEEKSHKAKGVISAELPKVSFDKDGNLRGISHLKIFFTNVEDALDIVTAEDTQIRIRVAEQLYQADGGYGFKPRQHIFIVDRESMWFSPGYTKRGELSTASPPRIIAFSEFRYAHSAESPISDRIFVGVVCRTSAFFRASREFNSAWIIACFSSARITVKPFKACL